MTSRSRAAIQALCLVALGMLLIGIFPRATRFAAWTSSTLTSMPVTRWPRSRNFWASASARKTIVESYSYIPESKIAPIAKRLTRGTNPSAVGVPCGDMRLIQSPTPTPRSFASSKPMMIWFTSTVASLPSTTVCTFTGLPRLVADPSRTWLDTSMTESTRSGSIPRTTAPATAWAVVAIT